MALTQGANAALSLPCELSATAKDASIMTQIEDKLRLLLQIQRGFLFQYGWLRSWWKGRPVDARGAPLPWITYPAIDFLSQFDFSDASVFEWGSGFSTLWWSQRCRRIASVESNQDWVLYIKQLLPKSVDLLVTALDANSEIEALTKHHTVRNDVFVIDNYGPFRRYCAEAAADNVTDGGLIVLDNSDQCPRAAEVLRIRGFTQIDFTGFAPGNGYAQSTSLFFRQYLKFATSQKDQPRLSPAQPNSTWKDC